MEMPGIVESGEDMQLCSLVGDQVVSILGKIYLALYAKNFQMDLDFGEGTNPSGNASLGNNYRCM